MPKSISINLNLSAITFWAITSFALFSGCQDESLYNRGSLEGNEIAFLVKDNGAWHTRSEENPGSFEIGPSTVMAGDCVNDTIYLHSFVEEGIQGDDALKTGNANTRSEVAGDDFEFYATAALYRGEWDETAERNEYLHDIRFVKNGQWWLPSAEGTYFWPASGQNLRFFAYGFTNLNENELGNSYVEIDEAAISGSPIFHYAIASADEAQRDLVFAKVDDFTSSVSISEDAVAPQLEFDHVLTKIVFKADTKIKGTISKISLKNIKCNGTYRQLGLNNDSEENNSGWTCDESVTDYSQSISAVIDPDEKETFELDGYQSLFLIPQEFEEESTAQIEVTFIDGLISKSRTLTVKLSDGWKPGTTVTYVLSTDNITFESEISFESWNICANKVLSSISELNLMAIGDKQCVRVTSNLKNKYLNGYDMSAPYKFNYDFVEYDGEKINVLDKLPDWLSMSSENFVSSNGTQRIYASAKYCDNNSELNVGNKLLRSKQPSNKIINLADKENGLTTANCYIVNSPGKYSFPVVYGNALKDGLPNKEAYDMSSYTDVGSGSSKAYALKNFVDYNNIAITSLTSIENEIPYIVKSGDDKDYKAGLVWQDVPDMVLNVSYDKTLRQIAFDIPQENIKQGNAVIALYDGDSDESNIMWSWHIWVTYIDPDDDSNWTKTGTSDNMTSSLNYFLGWCDPEDVECEERKVTLRLWQEDANGVRIGEYRYFDIKQEAYSATNVIYGSAPTYQWGRKDPMCPASYYDNAWTFKGTFPSCIKQVMSGTRPIGTLIKNPHSWYYSGQEGLIRTYYYNPWGANYVSSSENNIEESSVKTIYDPCPVGMKIPTVSEASLGSKQTVTKMPNGFSITYELAGDNFVYNCPFIPFLNTQYDSEYKGTSSVLRIFTSNNYNKSSSYCVNISGSGYNPKNTNNKTEACPIRPVKDNGY